MSEPVLKYHVYNPTFYLLLMSMIGVYKGDFIRQVQLYMLLALKLF